MNKIIKLSFLFLLSTVSATPQGCVAIRNLTGFGKFAQLGYNQTSEKWSMDVENRYFEAYKFLQGTTNITPSNLNSGITLYEYTMNFELTRLMDHGWSVSLDMPITSNESKGALEHASGDVHTTHAFGLGDIRFTVYKWLLNSDVYHKGNIQFGLGIKFPTGNYQTQDYFYTDPSDKSYKQLAPVNVAIQLGDGGTGITTQMNTYYIFNPHTSLYGNFFYLISPKDVNGVAAWPPGLLSPAAVTLFHETTYDVNSVPDNYSMRGGANFTFNELVLTAGLRYEGAPAHDLIGKDDGLRRVGHIFSGEPGIQYKFKKSYLYGFVTIPIDRATIETLPDKEQAAITGKLTITPGHFANYLIYVGYSFNF
jgi:hypothetical protein